MTETRAPRPGISTEATPREAPAAAPAPKRQHGLMPWPRVVEQLARAQNYWLATTRPDGRPHVTPIWGVWAHDACYFQGAPDSRWVRNLRENPAASVHLESGEVVVIIDGEAEHLVTDADLAARLVEAWRVKYGHSEPRPASDGLFRLQPRVARGWSRAADDGALWKFTGF